MFSDCDYWMMLIPACSLSSARLMQVVVCVGMKGYWWFACLIDGVGGGA